MKSNWQKKYRSDVLIAITIAVLPFLGYTHLLFSKDLRTLILFGLEYSHVFPNNRHFVWDLMKDIIPFTLLMIWFATISMRLKYSILPLFMLYFNDILDCLFKPYGKYTFYPFYYENYPLTIKILTITIVIGIIVYCDFNYFKSYRKRLLEISIKSLMGGNIRKSNNFYQENFKSLIEKRDKITRTSYLQKIYNAKLILENRLNNHTSSINDLVITNLDRLNLIVVCLLVFTTLLWFMHFLVPEKLVWVLGIVLLNNNGFLNVRIFIWFLLQKLIILIPMVLWFVMCRHWWKYAILSPIILYSFQFWEATQDVSLLDAAGNIKAFPAIFCVVLLLLVISKAIKYRVEILIMYEHLAEEIEDLLKNADFNANSVLYKNVKRFKKLKEDVDQETNAQQQLMKLITLREELVKHLNINY